MRTIVKVKKDGNGTITDVMLDNGQVYPMAEAIQMTRSHQIEGVTIGRARDGNEFIRGYGDGDPSNNLDSLPTF